MLVRLLSCCLAILLCACSASDPGLTTYRGGWRAPAMPCDVWIRGGLVVDGSGSDPARADVLVKDGEIVYVGVIDNCKAARTIDARGKVVTPGFVDPHSHGDPRRTPGFANFLRMGVATICLGQDGYSSGGKALRDWQQAVERGRFAPNIATMVGHGTVRRLSGIGLSSDPTDKFSAPRGRNAPRRSQPPTSR